MKTFKMHEIWGEFASDGTLANDFRAREVVPLLQRGEFVIFDFEGVTNLTSSFANALVANLVQRYVEIFPELVRFKNCNEAVKTLLTIAISLGRREARELAESAQAKAVMQPS